MENIDIKIDQGILKLQSKIGLPENFFKNLLNEDDWSFVIKLHAMIEAIATSLIVFHFDEPNIKNIISRLEMSNNTTGKLAFLKATGLVGKHNLKFINSLSELRNKFVHNVENCSITLKDWISNFDKNQLKSFAFSFSPFEVSYLEFEKVEFAINKKKLRDDVNITAKSIIERAKNNPKVHIWSGAYNVLTMISDSYYYSDFLQWEKSKKIMNEDREIL